jgi:starch synthase
MAPDHAPQTIFFAASELAPWTQVGGLGEVARDLPRGLVDAGLDVTVLTPLHRSGREALGPLSERGRGSFSFAGERRDFRIMERVEDANSESARPPAPDVLFLEAADFFETEDDPYGREPGLGGVGHLRYLFFSCALRPAMRALGLQPDLIHVHDWHGALGCAVDRLRYRDDDDAASSTWYLSVHNALHRGRVSREDWNAAELGDGILVAPLVSDGEPELLRIGLALADGVSTVSPAYARELMTESGPFVDLLESRSDGFRGILDAIDTELWNPARDPYLPANYGADDEDDFAGKEICRQALRRELGLDATEGPLFGVVARLDRQKGIDLLIEAAPALIEKHDACLAVLGRGDQSLEESLRELARRHPGRVAPRIRFDVPLAHRIEAGSDLFLMPSRFEPCGLNQMISLRYGTPPVARRTGGIADSVGDDGFLFEEASAAALEAAATLAATEFRRQPELFRERCRRGMRRDFSWSARVPDYLEAYADACRDRARGEREAFLDGLPLEPREPFLAPQRRIPEHYPVDRLMLLPVDPRRVAAFWEVQGEAGRRILDALDEETLWCSRWELRLEECGEGHRWTLPVEGYARNWFFAVEPDRDYRAELWMLTGESDETLMARSGRIAVPPEIGPR